MSDRGEALAFFNQLPHNELLALLWEQLEIRADPSTTREELLTAALMESRPTQTGPINKMRDELSLFIEKNRLELSLECDGACYEHTDATVMLCHRQLQLDIEQINHINTIRALLARQDK